MPENDEFSADSSENGSNGFSLDKFYPNARDRKGFATTKRLNLPPTVYGHIGEFVARRIVPQYRTTDDVFRDAIVVGLNVRAQQFDEPGFTRIANDFTALAEAERNLEEIKVANRLVDTVQEIWDNAKTRQQRDNAVTSCEKLLQDVTDPEIIAKVQDLIRRYI